MNKILLLSPALRKKVESRVRQCLDIAAKEYGVQFEMPEIRYDIKNTHGGIAYHKDWMIRLNLILLIENEEHFIQQTVAHEVAHLVNRRVHRPPEGKKRLMPHGNEWKKVMGLFRLPPKRTHNYNCASIEKAKKRVRAGTGLTRLERIQRQISKLGLEDKELLLAHLLHESDK